MSAAKTPDVGVSRRSEAPAMSGTRQGTHDYPPPFVEEPKGSHTQSMVVLHGRGDTGQNFAFMWLLVRGTDQRTLPESFPGCRFIFPTAALRRCAVLNRTRVHQWFDIASLVDPGKHSEQQYEGIRDSTAVIRGILEEEAAVVGWENVALVGLSQGCAVGLHALLNLCPQGIADGPEHKHLAAFFGMSGWLPFAKQIRETCLEKPELADQDVVFEEPAGANRDDGENTAVQPRIKDRAHAAMDLAREIAELPRLELSPLREPPFIHTPVFIGHGTADPKVAVRLGEEARDVLMGLGCDVKYQPYEGFGHWYKVPDEIDDLVEFLRALGGTWVEGS